MTAQTRALSLLLLSLPVLAAGCSPESDEGSPQGELLFGLADEDVEQLQLEYLPDEDLEQVRAKLTAPFDCSLYGDMCAQVGREEAIEITAQQVEQMLAGASLDEIQAELDVAIPAASKARRELEAELPNGEPEVERDTFRSTSEWATRQKGAYRLRVRNGLTTPLLGDRRAWTESKLQEQDWAGIWWAVNGTEICANTGNNTQVERWELLVPAGLYVLEDKDPAKACLVGDSSLEQETLHARHSFTDLPGWEFYYDITVRGCGSALINGITLGICADDLVECF